MSETNSSRDPGSLRILVVDDDASNRSLLGSFLGEHNFKIEFAASGEEALERLSAVACDMMISDVRMPGISGLDALRRARETFPTLPVLLVTAYADIHGAVNAMRDGALNYLEKPINLDEVLDCIHQALGLGEYDKHLKREKYVLPENVVGESPAIRDVFREAALVAPSQARVLVTGESGAGKEVIADLIHGWSPRAQGPLVKVNCAAIPETLLESELFGHEKGAFTGAVLKRVGRFEEANGGTIFLDEVSEMVPALQAKLLRVIQNGTFQRVGSNVERHTDARVLAATHCDLEEEVKAGRFREDLFYRLNVIEIYTPPLRERSADIMPLASRFASRFSGGGNPRFSASVATCLALYSWPGNVRELQNAMERAILMARGEVILPEHLPKRIQQAGMGEEVNTGRAATGKRMEEIEQIVILQTLRENNFNRTETARSLGISRRSLIYKLRRFAEDGHTIEAGKQEV